MRDAELQQEEDPDLIPWKRLRRTEIRMTDSTSDNVRYSTHSPRTLTQGFDHCEDSALELLRTEQLRMERARSDPCGNWEAEQTWLEEAIGRVLVPEEVPRFFKALGAEVLDDRDADIGG